VVLVTILIRSSKAMLEYHSNLSQKNKNSNQANDSPANPRIHDDSEMLNDFRRLGNHVNKKDAKTLNYEEATHPSNVNSQLRVL